MIRYLLDNFVHLRIIGNALLTLLRSRPNGQIVDNRATSHVRDTDRMVLKSDEPMLNESIGDFVSLVLTEVNLAGRMQPALFSGP